MFTPNKKGKIPNSPLSQAFGSSDFTLASREVQKRRYKAKDSGDKQNVAKDALIEIALCQFSTPQKKINNAKPLAIDSWMEDEANHKNESNTAKVFEINQRYSRNTRFVISSTNKDLYQQNAMLKLKEALKKLQSPQKNRTDRKILSQHKNQLLEVLISKRKTQTKVSDLIRLKQCQNFRSTGSSTNFQTRKISTSLDCRVKRKENGFNVQSSTPGKTHSFFNLNFKQGRKNRMLKATLQ